jgi:hypothetical protein
MAEKQKKNSFHFFQQCRVPITHAEDKRLMTVLCVLSDIFATPACAPTRPQLVITDHSDVERKNLA